MTAPRHQPVARDWQLYQRACEYINEGLIRVGAPPASAMTRRQWMESLLPALGHPEQSYEAIHVAGTSGKGSVATQIAQMLRAAGVRTGLHVSPYLQVATEKLWCDGAYASATELHQLVEWIRPICEARRRPDVPLHGMASVAIALEHFRRCNVTLGVMEAGVGGRSDLTNVMRTRVAVITAVGLDHVKTLGPDLDAIAWHKAGVIKPGCRAVVLDGPAVAAARRQASDVGAQLTVLDHSRFGATTGADGELLLDYRGPRIELRRVRLGMRGAFQAENAALALAALEQLELDLDPEALREGLARARLPGRLELMPPSARNVAPVLLDGAHNPDKLEAMLGGLSGLSRRRLLVVYGALGSRTPDPQLLRLARQAHAVLLTEPQVYQKTARPAQELLQLLRQSCPRVEIQRPALTALRSALELASPDDLVLVTGSLYLCGEAREHWYPSDEVVHRRTSWW